VTKTTLVTFAATLSVGVLLSACDDDKEAKLVAMAQVDASKPVAAPVATSTYDAAPPPKKQYVCAAPPGVDFHGNTALETEVRRKLGGRDGGTISQTDLKQIKSINLSQAKVDDLDPCVYPLFTSVKDLFLGAGDLDDLTAIAPLTHSTRLSANSDRRSAARPAPSADRTASSDSRRTVRASTRLATFELAITNSRAEAVNSTHKIVLALELIWSCILVTVMV